MEIYLNLYVSELIKQKQKNHLLYFFTANDIPIEVNFQIFVGLGR